MGFLECPFRIPSPSISLLINRGMLESQVIYRGEYFKETIETVWGGLRGNKSALDEWELRDTCTFVCDIGSNFREADCVISFKCQEIDFETGEKCVDVFESYRFYQRSYPPIETPVGQPLFPLTPSFISREIVRVKIIARTIQIPFQSLSLSLSLSEQDDVNLSTVVGIKVHYWKIKRVGKKKKKKCENIAVRNS